MTQQIMRKNKRDTLEIKKIHLFKFKNSTDVKVNRLKTAKKKTNWNIDQKKLSTMQYEEIKKWGKKIEGS